MKAVANSQMFHSYFLRDAPRRFSLLPPIMYAGFLAEKRHRVERLFDTCSFSFVLSGRGTYVHRGRVIRVTPPCLLLQWPGEPMNYGPDVAWDEAFLTYSGDLLETFRKCGFMDLDNPVRPISDPEGVRVQADRLRQLLQRAAPDADRVDDCGYSLLLAALTSAPADLAKVPARIARIEQLLEEGIGAFIDCEALARKCGMSLSSLRRYWRLYHGRETFQDYRDSVFRFRACRLLVETDKPICDIAPELNFADPFYFSRKFTALIGVPPSEYRRANRIGV